MRNGKCCQTETLHSAIAMAVQETVPKEQKTNLPILQQCYFLHVS